MRKRTTNIHWALFVSLCLTTSDTLSKDSNADLSNRGATFHVGINGAPCAYVHPVQAMAVASPGDTIYLRPATYTSALNEMTMDLTFVQSEAGAPDFSGCEQEASSPQIEDVIIQVLGNSADTVGGMGKIRNGATVTFRDIWLRDASAEKGGILAVIEGSTLILDGARMTGGIASISGGNIYATAGSSVRLINGATVSQGHSTGNGGGVALFDDSLLYIRNSYIGVSNSDFNTAANDGGGVYASDSTISMANNLGRVIWNQANHYGGGIYATNSVITTGLVSKISNNSGTTGGGGIYLASNSIATITRTTISDNSSSNGGGVYVNDSEFIVDDSTISGNISGQVGGGIFCSACNTISITNGSIISENLAGSGGGMFVSDFDGLITVSNSQILNNQAYSPTEGHGGGIAITSGSLLLSNSLVNDNTALLNGGGVYARRQGEDSLENIEFNNVALTGNISNNQYSPEGGGGGGAYIYRPDFLSVIDSLFQANTAVGSGGGLFITGSFSLPFSVLVSGSVFVDNMTNKHGGGLYSRYSLLTVNLDSFFSNNSADQAGGAIYLSSGTGNINGVTFDSNQAAYGGGIHTNQTILDVTNSHFTNNEATFFGGGLYIGNSDFSFRSVMGQGDGQCDPFALPANQYCSQLINNYGRSGGAIAIRNSSTSTDKAYVLSDLAIISNTSLEANGGSAIYIFDDGSTIDLTNLLLVDNSTISEPATVIELNGSNTLKLDSVTIANNYGSPLWAEDIASNIEMFNSILSGNSKGPRVAFGMSSFVRDCNNSQAVSIPSQPMGGNIGDPLFITTARGDYRLAANSPSIDQCTTGPTRDLDGLYRPNLTGIYDQGAFETEGVQFMDLIFSNGFDN